MDCGLYNIFVLLDLKKAFDTVNHKSLLHKFEQYGVGNKALDLSSNYLTNQTEMSAKWNAFRSETNNLPHPSGKYTWTSSVYYLYQRFAKLSQTYNTKDVCR